MKKYMGNKSKIVSAIYEAAQELYPRPGTLFDAFSGTTNVGQYFKKQGYSVISNDVNATSRLLGEVYLRQNALPSFDTLFESNCYSIQRIRKLTEEGTFQNAIQEFLSLNHNTNDETYMLSIQNTNAFRLLVYLSFFANDTDYIEGHYIYKLQAPDFIWRNFCFYGTNSKYFNLVSQKSILSQIQKLESCGRRYNLSASLLPVIDLLHRVYTPPYDTASLSEAIRLLHNIAAEADNSNNVQPEKSSDASAPTEPAAHQTTVLLQAAEKLTALSRRTNHVGNRMFFSEIHGHKIDAINNLALVWLRDGLITTDEYHYILCALVEAAALFSNTSATYQAFYKTYRDNTQQTFRLIVPEIIPSEKEHYIYCEDTFELIQHIPQTYDILYLDPPYNWRIYDSNYHLLNLLSNFNQIADSILEYESGIAGAAGENRTLIREYTNYNRRDTFEDLLFQLILRASCRYVIISYSDSRSNHNKNSLSSVNRIEAFLRDETYFVPGSYRKIELNSINFESRKSERKDKIHELLFIAEKKTKEPMLRCDE